MDFLSCLSLPLKWGRQRQNRDTPPKLDYCILRLDFLPCKHSVRPSAVGTLDRTLLMRLRAAMMVSEYRKHAAGSHRAPRSTSCSILRLPHGHWERKSQQMAIASWLLLPSFEIPCPGSNGGSTLSSLPFFFSFNKKYTSKKSHEVNFTISPWPYVRTPAWLLEVTGFSFRVGEDGYKTALL